MEYIKQDELRKRVGELGYELLLDLTIVDYLKYPIKKKHRFEAVYIFRSLESFESKIFKIELESEELDSISDIYEAANWLEREAFDQYGIKFKNHPNLKRILNHHQFIGHPLRKDYKITDYQLCTSSDSLMDEMGVKLLQKGFDVKLPFCEVENKNLGTDLMFLNIGPSHPASHGTIRTLVALDGEKIITAVNEIGYLHRGFEKSCENHTYNQIIPYTDRLNYCSAMINNFAFAKAVESSLGVEITDRAKFIRVIISELSRIIDHIVCLAAQLVDCGGLTNFWYLYNQREDTYELLQKLTGARLTNSFARIGGLKHDLYDGFERDLEDVLKKIEEGVDDTLTLIASNKIFLDRVQDVCKISDKEAISYGFSGPTLRASGVPFDLRKDKPYYYYDSFNFAVPIGSYGDIYDRVMVRFEEIKESSKIIRQAMAKLPEGAINIDMPSIVLPNKTDVYGNIEGLMNHFKLVFEGVKVPIGEHYDSLEGANGELGFYIVSDGSGTPYKVKVRPPCFFNMASMAKSVENHQVADAVLQLGSLNIIAGELDR